MLEREKKILYSILGDELVNRLKKYKCFIAGGCITSLFCAREIHDIDIYFRSSKDFFYFCDAELSIRNVLLVSKTNRAITYINKQYDTLSRNNKNSIIKEYIPIQCIGFDFFNSAEEIFKSFDFTVCMGAFDFSIEQFVLDNRFLLDNASKKLYVNMNTKYPICTLFRVDKYKKYGYSISKYEYIKIITAIHNLKCDSWDEFKEQLGNNYGEKIVINIDDSDFSWDKVFEMLESNDNSVVFNNNIACECCADIYNEKTRRNLLHDVCGYKEQIKAICSNNDMVLYIRDGKFNVYDKQRCEDIKYIEIILPKNKFIYLYKFIKNNDGVYKFFEYDNELHLHKTNSIKTGYFTLATICESQRNNEPDRALGQFIINVDDIDMNILSSSNFIKAQHSKLNRILHDVKKDGFIPIDDEFFDEVE